MTREIRESDGGGGDEPGRPEEVGEELGLREARSMLGELAHRAGYLGAVTYLTKNGRRLAAVVPAETAQTRDGARVAQVANAEEAETLRREYEGLDRAAQAVLSGPEVWWARAYLRVWKALDQVDADFYHAVEQAYLAEKRQDAERDERGDWDDPDADPAPVDYLAAVTELRKAEEDRIEFARRISERVEELADSDARHPGQAEALDWVGWAERVEALLHTITTARPAPRQFIAQTARKRLRTALAEAATMLGELEQAPPPAGEPDGWTTRKLWQLASSVLAAPLWTSMNDLGHHLGLPADSAQHALVKLHKEGRVRCYRYWRGRQTEIDPAQIIPEAGFHLVLIGPDDEDHPGTRPAVIVGM